MCVGNTVILLLLTSILVSMSGRAGKEVRLGQWSIQRIFKYGGKVGMVVIGFEPKYKSVKYGGSGDGIAAM